MQNNRWTDLKEIFLKDIPIIDVRASVEFNEGAIPGSVNLPILQDDERAQVGTVYKQKGQIEAIKLGHQLVSGAIKQQRIQAWKNFIDGHPDAILTCFRGGLRSRTTQAWLAEAGIDRPLIEGGYKKTRNFLLQNIEELPKTRQWLVISGATGSGKTELLRELQGSLACLDLEWIAKHRGSAFGAYLEPQPTQINFENLIAKDLIKIEDQFPSIKPLIVEDESRMIGSRSQPLAVFEKIRSSEVIWLEDPIEVRVQRIAKEYLSHPLKIANDPEAVFLRMSAAVNAIQKKLGGLRHSEIIKLIQDSKAEYLQTQSLQIAQVWIQKLLEFYYDPLYFKSLDRRQVKVKFRGTYDSCRDYLKNI